MKQQLAKQVYDLYKRSLNHKSKWYNDDLADFKAIVQTKTVEQLRQQLANMRGIMGLDVPSQYVYDIKQRMHRIEYILLARYKHDIYSMPLNKR